jgi:polysaccharide export outer membrane protein
VIPVVSWAIRLLFLRPVWFVLTALMLIAVGCGPKPDNSHVNLPPPVQSTSVGPGDIFTMEIVGEKELPQEYQVASDGSVDLPYLERLTVEGLEPQQIQALVTERLVAAEIYQNPSVVVRVEEYNSKRVTVLGQVQKPGSFPLTPGLTLVQAVSLAGGLNSIANRDKVKLTRKTAEGSQTVVLSFQAITDGRSPDIPLQAGDSIYVHERVF